MGVETILAVTAIAGAGIAAGGKIAESSARKDMTRDSIRAENAREEQMNVEAERQQREIIRKAQVARSTSIARGANQGALYGSAVPGSEGQIESQAGRESNAVYQNQQIGGEIFDANREYAHDSSRASTAAAYASFGTTLIGLSQPIGKIGSTLFNSTVKTASGADAYGNPLLP